MRHLVNTTIRLPLFLRVVALYALVGLPTWTIGTLQPQAAPVQASVITVKRLALPTTMPDISAGHPNSLSIPALGIDLPVIDGAYDTSSDSWTLSDDKVQFASMTSEPNNRTGNTFMYGHNTEAVFMPLARLQIGDEVIIRTVNGLSFVYTLKSQDLVMPNDTDILRPTSGPSLTLMTCEGVFSEARRVAVFDFEKVL